MMDKDSELREIVNALRERMEFADVKTRHHYFLNIGQGIIRCIAEG
jgi:hypothetical protein